MPTGLARGHLTVKFAVTVLFEIELDRMSDFMPLMLENARTSLREEEGCLQFDVCTDQERPGEVCLYEVYSSQGAFSKHLASAHFKAFDAAAREMIKGKEIKTYRTVA